MLLDPGPARLFPQNPATPKRPSLKRRKRSHVENIPTNLATHIRIINPSAAFPTVFTAMRPFQRRWDGDTTNSC